jgi:hypothetical protein
MGFLTALGGPIIKAITGSLFGSAENIFKAYFAKEISKEEALAHLGEAVVQAFAQVEQAYAQSLSSTYASFMGAVKESKALQYGWLTVVLSQVLVLVVHQLVIPALAVMAWLPHPWKSGTTIEYAYLLLSVCMGAGAIALKAGTNSGYVDAFRGLIKR